MSSEPQESYSSPGFAEFYDEMVKRLPLEFEAGADVEHVCWPLLCELATGDRGTGNSVSPDLAAGGRRTCSPPQALTVLDMCTGTGRIALGLAARWMAWGCTPRSARLAIVGVDSSPEMLAAARIKAAAAAQSPAVAGGGSSAGVNSSSCTCDLTWLLADMAAPQPPVPPDSCVLVTLVAGSFHHLVTPRDQAAALRGLAACLRRPPAHAFLVLSLLGPEHLAAESGQVMLAGPFRRTCLAAVCEAAPGGGALWRHRFRLQRYASEMAVAAGDDAAKLWDCEEAWTLREVAPADLERLAAAAGLRVVRRQARWSDGWGGAAPVCAPADARVFVLALENA